MKGLLVNNLWSSKNIDVKVCDVPLIKVSVMAWP